MEMDTLIYAVVAVIIISRLWSVLGRRNEEDSERQNPFVAPEKPLLPPRDDEHFLPGEKLSEIPPVMRPLRAAPDSLIGGLEQVKAIDNKFDEKQFLQGARAAFTMIIDEYFKGDLTNSNRVLGDSVRTRFQNALDERQKLGQKVENKLVQVKEVECVKARAEGKQAFVTVRYVSEQTLITRDMNGAIISGVEGKTEEIIDLWTFARDTTSSDPNWTLIETKA